MPPTPPPDSLLDSAGLAYTLSPTGETCVHYHNGVTYGAPLVFEFPASYFTNPPNEVTRHRAAIVLALRARPTPAES